MSPKTPATTVTMEFCRECGRTQAQPFGQTHFSDGKRCRGIPRRIVYVYRRTERKRILR